MLNRESSIRFRPANWSVLDTCLCFFFTEQVCILPFYIQYSTETIYLHYFLKRHCNLQVNCSSPKINALPPFCLQLHAVTLQRDVFWIIFLWFQSDRASKTSERAAVLWFRAWTFCLKNLKRLWKHSYVIASHPQITVLPQPGKCTASPSNLST